MRENPFEINKDVEVAIWSAEWFAEAMGKNIIEMLEEFGIPKDVYEKYKAQQKQEQ